MQSTIHSRLGRSSRRSDGSDGRARCRTDHNVERVNGRVDIAEPPGTVVSDHSEGVCIQNQLDVLHDRALAAITDDVVPVPDGGQPAPSLPTNWRSVSRPDRREFQRKDRDHYIVLGDGVDEWLVILCSQGDRACPAPLASRTVTVDGDVEQAIRDLAAESNDLIEPPEGEH